MIASLPGRSSAFHRGAIWVICPRQPFVMPPKISSSFNVEVGGGNFWPVDTAKLLTPG